MKKKSMNYYLVTTAECFHFPSERLWNPAVIQLRDHSQNSTTTGMSADGHSAPLYAKMSGQDYPKRWPKNYQRILTMQEIQSVVSSPLEQFIMEIENCLLWENRLLKGCKYFLRMNVKVSSLTSKQYIPHVLKVVQLWNGLLQLLSESGEQTFWGYSIKCFTHLYWPWYINIQNCCSYHHLLITREMTHYPISQILFKYH